MQPTIGDRARQRAINQFLGCSMRTLKARLENIDAELKAINESDEGGAVDGREWRIEAITDLENEIKRREALKTFGAVK